MTIKEKILYYEKHHGFNIILFRVGLELYNESKLTKWDFPKWDFLNASPNFLTPLLESLFLASVY